jgi:hypothetical protein
VSPTETLTGTAILSDGTSLTQSVTVNVTTGAAPTPLLGRSSSNNDHGPLTQCSLVRDYQFGAVDADLAESGASALFLSDEGGVSTAAQLDSKLAALFVKHPTTVVYYSPENEVTANDLTAAQAAAYIEKTRTMRIICNKYPNAYMAINLTAYGVRQGRHLQLQPCAQYLEAITASCYNPGRSDTPPTWDAYPDYLDPLLDVARDWGRLPFGCGEFGNPISPTDPNKRPSYGAGMVRYLRDGCAARGVVFLGASWWDNQKAGGPNNRLSADNPLTAQAWKTALD